MLGKLLKYDLKWIYKVVVVFYLLAIFFSIVGRCFVSIDDSLLFNIIGKISIGVAISMMISSLINSLMRSWVRFMRNLYKDESYLTHTLPVSKKTIYLSKVLSAIITAFTTTVVIIICLFICYYSKSNIELLKTTLELTASIYNTTVIRLLLMTSFTIFLEVVFIILIGYVGIILGHQANDNKVLKSIIISFVLYLVTQAVTILLLVVIGLIFPDIMNIVKTTNIVGVDTIKSVMYVGMGIYLVYIIFYYLLGQHQLEKGVNVD